MKRNSQLDNFTFLQCWCKNAISELTVPSDNIPSHSWITSSRHLTGTHMETQIWKSAPVRSSPPCGPRSDRTQGLNRTEPKATYFVSRWEVLQSLLRVPKFICIHLSWQSKTWPLITAWLLWKGGQNETPVAVLRIWQAWEEVPDDKTHVDLLVNNSFWQAGVTESFPAVCRYSSVSFIYVDPNRGTRSRRESWVLFCRGVTESGALDSSLSFLNRFSVSKAMANARSGVKLQTKRLSRATARLPRVTAWILPKPPPCKGRAYEWTAVTHGAQLGVDWNSGTDTPTAAPDFLSSIRLAISQCVKWWQDVFIILVIHSCFLKPLLTQQPC